MEDNETLARESEYSSWVIYNRYYLNHFTISVHNLPEGFNSVENFNQFLEAQGIVLNDAGGKVKTSPDGGLRQSATVAKKVLARFLGGEELLIPGSYVEFAERSILPEFAGLPKHKIKRQHRREGFEAANANRIFESTYRAQTKRI